MQNALVIVGIGVAILLTGWYFMARSAENSQKEGSTIETMTGTLALSSKAFASGASIPAMYTCDGAEASPPLAWSGVPEGTKSFALLMDDPDIPQVFKDRNNIDSFDHWVLFNIPSTISGIPEGLDAGTVGKSGAGSNAYVGPCPPKEYEPSEHRYVFRLYALDSELALSPSATKADVLSAMKGHILETAELLGKYKRP